MASTTIARVTAAELSAMQSASSSIPQQPPAPMVQGGGQLPLYPPLVCSIPNLLENLTPAILRSHMTTAQFKPIPNNERVDLAGFRVKEPVEWTPDDVVAWMLDVARSNSIPVEDFNITRFAPLDGKQMMRMCEQHFVDLDPTYGHVFFREFRKLLTTSLEDTVIDAAMRRYRESEEEPQTLQNQRNELSQQMCTDLGAQQLSIQAQTQALLKAQQDIRQQIQHNLQQSIQQNIQQNLQQNMQNSLQQQGFQHNLQQQNQLHNLQQNHLQSLNNIQQNLQQQGLTTVQLAQSLAAAGNLNITNNIANLTNLSTIQQMQNALSPRSPMNQPRVSPLPKPELISKYVNQQPTTSNNDCDDSDEESSSKVKLNKDGRPRKRSQHTKGNKLWEFIRDALKDPTTCPSIVRWEDPVEGVFRIVESEKLARLWGERKNNHKMTYEKLSRAMRTYYEKQILVPVPKTGLYPKKLVYKFGPGAHGWETCKREP